MTIGTVNNQPFDFSYLTAAIDRSVSNIKSRTVSASEPQPLPQNDNISSPGWSARGFAVSYLEPNALYTLQKMVSDFHFEEPPQNRRAGSYTLQSEEKNATKTDSSVSESDFGTAVEGVYSASDYAKVSAVYQQNIGFSLPQLKVIFSGRPIAENPLQYAADAYNHSLELNKSPSVLIDFFHPNNRSFDLNI